MNKFLKLALIGILLYVLAFIIVFSYKMVDFSYFSQIEGVGHKIWIGALCFLIMLFDALVTTIVILVVNAFVMRTTGIMGVWKDSRNFLLCSTSSAIIGCIVAFRAQIHYLPYSPSFEEMLILITFGIIMTNRINVWGQTYRRSP